MATTTKPTVCAQCGEWVIIASDLGNGPGTPVHAFPADDGHEPVVVTEQEDQS